MRRRLGFALALALAFGATFALTRHLTRTPAAAQPRAAAQPTPAPPRAGAAPRASAPGEARTRVQLMTPARTDWQRATDGAPSGARLSLEAALGTLVDDAIEDAEDCLLGRELLAATIARYTMHVVATADRVTITGMRFLEVADGIEIDPAALACIDRAVAGSHATEPLAPGIRYLPYEGPYIADVVFAARSAAAGE